MYSIATASNYLAVVGNGRHPVILLRACAMFSLGGLVTRLDSLCISHAHDRHVDSIFIFIDNIDYVNGPGWETAHVSHRHACACAYKRFAHSVL